MIDEIIKKRYPFYNPDLSTADIEINGEQVKQLMLDLLDVYIEWWNGLSQEELAWYEGRYMQVFLNGLGPSDFINDCTY